MGAAQDDDFDEYDDDEPSRTQKEVAEDEYVELDLDKTLTWTGNAVTVQAGGEFRMPLLVPYPSVLAIQFEVEGGYDLEFSLTFKDDHEVESNVLVEPVRVSDREGQLDIDTTGVCEIIWSNAHAWMTSKTLSYQLQLAPKVDMRWRKRTVAAVTAACDFRMLAAVEMADKIDEDMKTMKQRTTELQEAVSSSKEKTTSAQSKYERYMGHVRRLEEEVAAAKAHADAAAEELTAAHREEAEAERSLVTLQQVRQLDELVTPEVLKLIEQVSAPVEALFEAYAGSLYAPDKDDESDEESSPGLIDRAEVVHLLQDFDFVGRGQPPQLLCGVFASSPQQLSLAEFVRCFARAAIAFAPEDKSASEREEACAPADKVRETLLLLCKKADYVKLPVLDVRRRVGVLQALRELSAVLQSGS